MVRWLCSYGFGLTPISDRLPLALKNANLKHCLISTGEGRALTYSSNTPQKAQEKQAHGMRPYAEQLCTAQHVALQRGNTDSSVLSGTGALLATAQPTAAPAPTPLHLVQLPPHPQEVCFLLRATVFVLTHP